ETSRRAAGLHVHMQSFVRPVPRQTIAGAEPEIHLVALRVAVFVDERLAVLSVRAVVLLHGRVPAVRLRGPPAAGVVLGAARQELRTFLPSGPAVGPMELHELLVIPLVPGVLVEPLLDGGDDLLDRRD